MLKEELAVNTKQKGRLIAIEGPEGAGKSTQINHLKNLLQAKGYTVICTREPGGTPVGEQLRNLVLNEYVGIKSEILIFFASRLEHISQVIKPAIERGDIVITDRFIDSSYAYQGFGREALPFVEAVDNLVMDGFEADHTLYFSIPYELMLDRMRQRGGGPDRFEQEGQAFFTRVYEGYTRQSKLRGNVHVIDATQSVENVTAQLSTWVNDNF